MSVEKKEIDKIKPKNSDKSKSPFISMITGKIKEN